MQCQAFRLRAPLSILPHRPLLQLADSLRGMPAEEYAAHVEELAKAKLEKPKRLRDAVNTDWSEIDDGTLRWVILVAYRRRVFTSLGGALGKRTSPVHRSSSLTHP